MGLEGGKFSGLGGGVHVELVETGGDAVLIGLVAVIAVLSLRFITTAMLVQGPVPWVEQTGGAYRNQAHQPTAPPGTTVVSPSPTGVQSCAQSSSR